jgi:SNF2 family DNA or RNA helicase
MSTAACPLVTAYTTEQGIKPELLEHLYALRKHDVDIDPPVNFKWPSCLRIEIDSPPQPLRLREYQKVAIHHLARMPRFVLGDAVGLGKTLDCIAAAAYIKDRYPGVKVIVLTTKSTTYQWEEEVERFSTLKPYVMRDNFAGKKSYEARYAQLDTFLKSDVKDVMICKYSSLVGKRKKTNSKWDEKGNAVEGTVERVSQEIKEFCKILKPHASNVILICDEAHKFMHYNQTRKLVLNLSKYATAVWALTATAIKNHLDEFYSIGSAIGIRPLGYADDFHEKFCITHEIPIRGGFKKEIIIGYRNIPEFKDAMRPFFLGRSQKQVKEPLPILSTVYHPIDLDDEQSDLLLNQIPSGEWPLPPRLIEVANEFGEVSVYEKERDPENKMTMLSVYQLVANHPALLDPDNVEEFYTKKLSPKEEALLDMLDGDFAGEKVIVYTKYRSWINRLERLTRDGHFTSRKFLRITGNESEKQRNVNKQKFQDPNSGYDLIVINAAGMEGINLQSAAHMICLDVPWSWGDLIQLVGRMVRMASPHSMCTLHVMVAKGTIDEYAIETLKGKKGIFDAILGQSHSAGLLEDAGVFDLSSGMDAFGSDDDFRAMLRVHAKKYTMTKFVAGERLTKAVGDEDYLMSFQQTKADKPKKKKDSHEDLFKQWGGETVL